MVLSGHSDTESWETGSAFGLTPPSPGRGHPPPQVGGRNAAPHAPNMSAGLGGCDCPLPPGLVPRPAGTTFPLPNRKGDQGVRRYLSPPFRASGPTFSGESSAVHELVAGGDYAPIEAVDALAG